MMKIFFVIFAVLVSAGCITDSGNDNSIISDKISEAEIPKECLEAKDDVCALFDCMVDLCWCDDSSPELPVLHESTGIAVTNEDEAKDVVIQYINDNNLEYQVTNIIQLNDVFFNVFASDGYGNEVVYTVASDGTIIKTICGV